jgi:DNA polymerase elongation subunit (family B)
VIEGDAPRLPGTRPVAGLLACALAPGGAAMRLYLRHGPARVVEVAPFTPFLLLADRAAVAGASGLLDGAALDGRGDLRWLARFDTWTSALAARERVRGLPHWFSADPVHQFLLATGHTAFGGMRFADLRRLALDIEVLTTEGYAFPSAARAGDRIIAIALADSTGFRQVLRGDRLSEPALIEECGRLLRDRDPDVVEGHNIFRFDLEYLETRARLHGVALAWGRGGEILRSRVAQLSIAERNIGYRRYELPGRHILDTYLLAQLHDAGTRDLPGFGLKDLARHFGVAAPRRTYLDPANISRTFREAPDELMAYAGDDAAEALALSGVLAPPYFVQAQLVPFDFQTTTLRGAAAKIDALLLREYLQARRAVPLPGPSAPVGGGFTAIRQRGVARPVWHVDVTSLYPSIMLGDAVAPASDSLRAFPRLLGALTDFRLAAKRGARAAGDASERVHLGALQQAFKILINAFYGYLAFGRGHWNDFAAADRVTAEGRRIIGLVLGELDRLGAIPIELDTDGVYFVPPPDETAGAEERLLTRLAGVLPAGIQLELAGRYAAMLSYKMKAYALADERGRLILRGSALRSRGLEPFVRQLIEEIVRLLLVGRAAEVRAAIERWRDDFGAHRVPVHLFARTETLQDPLEMYRDRVRDGLRSASAAYAVALASGRPFLPGDQISYYVAGRGANLSVAGSARLASAWNPDRPDENTEYYQSKVLEVWARFRPFTEFEGLRPHSETEGVPEESPQLDLFANPKAIGAQEPPTGIAAV